MSIDADAIIRDYAHFEHHRSGSDQDRASCQWLCQQLETLGFTTTTVEYEFPRFDAKWQCRIDGKRVESLPLFYSATGDFEFENLEVLPLKLNHWQESETLDLIAAMVDQQKARAKKALVVATESANGAVYAINVGVNLALDFPVLLIGSGSTHRGARADGFVKARILNGLSRNILAIRPMQKPELIITTPFSGWFNCAAERAAGIAVMLELVSRLQARFNLQVIATSGHELHHLGCDAIQKALNLAPGIPVLHIGSCVGVNDADLVFNTNINLSKAIRSLFAGIGARVIERDHRQSNAWPGESQNWVNAQRTIMSLAGADRNFHTSMDQAAQINTKPLASIVDTLEATAMLLEHPSG